MSNMIAASVFSGRKDPTTTMLNRLVVKGGNQQLKTFLDSSKYEGDEPVALPVFTLDTDTPKIKGARWYLQGKMSREVGFFTKDLFEGKTGKIFIKIDDLRIFAFPTNSTDSNVSAWIDSEALQVRWIEDKESITREEAEEDEIANFSVRACLQPETSNTALLWLAIVPLGKDDLIKKRPADYNTRKCPQIHLGIGPRSNPGQRSLSIRLAVAEGKREHCGYGIFPALESLSSDAALLPPAKDIREALHLHMRQAKGFNTKTATTITAALDQDSATTTTREPVRVWPELPEDVATTGTEEGRKDFTH